MRKRYWLLALSAAVALSVSSASAIDIKGQKERERKRGCENGGPWWDVLHVEVGRLEGATIAVPSQESDYLAKEDAASNRDGQERRRAALQARPYYAAWRVHRAAGAVLEAMSTLTELPRPSIKAKIIFGLDVAQKTEEFMLEWFEYRKTGFGSKMPAQEGFSRDFDATALSVHARAFINCQAVGLPGL